MVRAQCPAWLPGCLGQHEHWVSICHRRLHLKHRGPTCSSASRGSRPGCKVWRGKCQSTRPHPEIWQSVTRGVTSRWGAGAPRSLQERPVGHRPSCAEPPPAASSQVASWLRSPSAFPQARRPHTRQEQRQVPLGRRAFCRSIYKLAHVHANLTPNPGIFSGCVAANRRPVLGGDAPALLHGDPPSERVLPSLRLHASITAPGKG